MTAGIASSIVERVMGPEPEDLGTEFARHVINWRFPEPDIARMNDLAGKARAGNLSADECEELEIYNFVTDFIAIMKSKARRSLKLQGSRP